jgi:hypothetical protein
MFANHALATEVSEDKLDLADALLNVEGTKVEATVIRGEEAEFAAEVLAYAEFAQNDGGHRLLYVFKLRFVEVADRKTVSDAPQVNTEVVHPGVGFSAGNGSDFVGAGGARRRRREFCKTGRS